MGDHDWKRRRFQGSGTRRVDRAGRTGLHGAFGGNIRLRKDRIDNEGPTGDATFGRDRSKSFQWITGRQRRGLWPCTEIHSVRLLFRDVETRDTTMATGHRKCGLRTTQTC